jgi:hypothetical protein
MVDTRIVRRSTATAVACPPRLAAGLVVTSLFVSACMTSKVDETRQIAAAVQAHESIVVLKSRGCTYFALCAAITALKSAASRTTRLAGPSPSVAPAQSLPGDRAR